MVICIFGSGFGFGENVMNGFLEWDIGVWMAVIVADDVLGGWWEVQGLEDVLEIWGDFVGFCVVFFPAYCD